MQTREGWFGLSGDFRSRLQQAACSCLTFLRSWTHMAVSVLQMTDLAFLGICSRPKEHSLKINHTDDQCLAAPLKMHPLVTLLQS